MDNKGREAASDGATSLSMKALKLIYVGKFHICSDWEEDIQCSGQRSDRIRASCVASAAVGSKEFETRLLGCYRTASGSKQRRREIIDEKRVKDRAKNGSFPYASAKSKGTTFVILIIHANAPVRKKRLRLLNKARREASRNKFVIESGMPNRIKSFREVDIDKSCPIAWLGLVNPSEMD